MSVIQNSRLRQEAKEKDETIEDLKDQLAAMERKKVQVDEALFGANCELQHRNELIRALKKNNENLTEQEMKASAEAAYWKEKMEVDRLYARKTFEKQKKKSSEQLQEYKNMLAEERKKLEGIDEGYIKMIQLTKEDRNRKLGVMNFNLDQERAKVVALKVELEQEQTKVVELESELAQVRNQARLYYNEGVDWMNGFNCLRHETETGMYYRFLNQRNEELEQGIVVMRNRCAAVAEFGNVIIRQFCSRVDEAAMWHKPGMTPEAFNEFLDFCYEAIRKFKRTLRGAV